MIFTGMLLKESCTVMDACSVQVGLYVALKAFWYQFWSCHLELLWSEWTSLHDPIFGQVVHLDLLLCIGFNSEHKNCFHSYFNPETYEGSKVEQSNGSTWSVICSRKIYGTFIFTWNFNIMNVITVQKLQSIKNWVRVAALLSKARWRHCLQSMLQPPGPPCSWIKKLKLIWQ